MSSSAVPQRMSAFARAFLDQIGSGPSDDLDLDACFSGEDIGDLLESRVRPTGAVEPDDAIAGVMRDRRVGDFVGGSGRCQN